MVLAKEMIYRVGANVHFKREVRDSKCRFETFTNTQVRGYPGNEKSSSPGESHPQALRSGREPLDSSGSYCPAVGRIPICQWANRLGSLFAMRPNQ
jgi:hypothetical protein